MTAHDEPAGVERMAAVLERVYQCGPGAVHEGYGAECKSDAHARALYRTFGCDHAAHIAAALAEAGIGDVRYPEADRSYLSVEWERLAKSASKRADAAEARLREVEAERDRWKDRWRATVEDAETQRASLAELRAAFWECFTPDMAGVDWRDDEAIQRFARKAAALLRAAQGIGDVREAQEYTKEGRGMTELLTAEEREAVRQAAGGWLTNYNMLVHVAPVIERILAARLAAHEAPSEPEGGIRASIARGLAESAAGNVHDLGSFASYLGCGESGLTEPVIVDLDDPYFSGKSLPELLAEYGHVHSATGVCVKVAPSEPEGETVTEWGVRHPDGTVLHAATRDEAVSVVANATSWGSQPPPEWQPVSRTRTTYQDVVTDWTEVTD